MIFLLRSGLKALSGVISMIMLKIQSNLSKPDAEFIGKDSHCIKG